MRAVGGRIWFFVLAAVLGILGLQWNSPVRGTDSSRPLGESGRIAALLDVVEHSRVTFVRAGKEYSGAEGRKHLERKLHYAGDRIRTAEEFIEEIASRSSITGRPYLVRLPTGEEMEAGVWLRQRLRELDARP